MSGIVGTGGALTMAADCLGGCQGGMAPTPILNYGPGPDSVICSCDPCLKAGCPPACLCSQSGGGFGSPWGGLIPGYGGGYTGPAAGK